MNIFQISQELLDIFAELEENGGELTEELEAQLAVSQADFKTKVKSYTDVIKHTESEIDLIDKEIARLKALKDSKEKAIARLEKIIIWAVEMFGETTKSGGKFVDYGTGKVIIKNTEKVEINDDFASQTANSFMEEIRSLAYTKELYYNELKDNVSIPEEDIKGISINVNFDVPLESLYSKEGYNIITALYANNKFFKFKPNISKTDLKPKLKEHPDVYQKLARIVPNKTINIK